MVISRFLLTTDPLTLWRCRLNNIYLRPHQVLPKHISSLWRTDFILFMFWTLKFSMPNVKFSLNTTIINNVRVSISSEARIVLRRKCRVPESIARRLIFIQIVECLEFGSKRKLQNTPPPPAQQTQLNSGPWYVGYIFKEKLLSHFPTLNLPRCNPPGI